MLIVNWSKSNKTILSIDKLKTQISYMNNFVLRWSRMTCFCRSGGVRKGNDETGVSTRTSSPGEKLSGKWDHLTSRVSWLAKKKEVQRTDVCILLQYYFILFYFLRLAKLKCILSWWSRMDKTAGYSRRCWVERRRAWKQRFRARSNTSSRRRSVCWRNTSSRRRRASRNDSSYRYREQMFVFCNNTILLQESQLCWNSNVFCIELEWIRLPATPGDAG